MAVNPGFPKTAAQRHFEEFSSVLLKIMAELTEEDRGKFLIMRSICTTKKWRLKHDEK